MLSYATNTQDIKQIQNISNKKKSRKYKFMQDKDLCTQSTVIALTYATDLSAK